MTLDSLPSLAANPVLASWIAFSPGDKVTVFTGKVEYGQGVWTALAQIAAEELDVALARVAVAPVSTGASPDEGVTSGSLSIQHSGAALRQVCAQARALLLAAAAAKLGTVGAALVVDDGQILAGGRPTGLSYWSLASPGLLDRKAGAPVPVKPRDRWSVAGRSAPRLDLPDKVTGRPRFLHDLVLPGMRYGRVVRPPAVVAELLSTGDPELPAGVITVRDGSFLGGRGQQEALQVIGVRQRLGDPPPGRPRHQPRGAQRGCVGGRHDAEERAVAHGDCAGRQFRVAGAVQFRHDGRRPNYAAVPHAGQDEVVQEPWPPGDLVRVGDPRGRGLN